MRTLRLVLAGVLITLNVSSCELAKLGDPIIVSKVEDEFQVDLWESLSPEGRSLQFLIRTLEPEPCLNTKIDYRAERRGIHLSISLQDIIEPTDCTPGEAPASAAPEFETLTTGFYELEIDLKETVINRGQLTVFSDRYLIDMNTKNGLVFGHSELRRVPEGALWGYVSYEASEHAGLVDQFITDLEKITENRTYQQGYYGHFTIEDPAAAPLIKDQPETTNVQSFLYYYQGQSANLEELVSTYEQRFGSQLDIRLFTSRGEEW